MKTQEWIKSLLKSRGRKLKDAAEVLGIPAPRITDIIKGNREVQSDEIMPLASLMGISVTSLLTSLDQGTLVEMDEDQEGRLPIGGTIFGDGTITPLGAGETMQSVPIPPDAHTRDGLVCYSVGDDCLEQEIKKGSLIIAADPKKQYFPMVPGSIFLVRTDRDGLAPRLYHQSENGEDWLVPLPKDPNPAYESWPFSLFPARGRENAGRKTVHTEDIAYCVLWVQRRYSPQV